MTNTIKLLAVASVFLASSAFAANPPAAPEREAQPAVKAALGRPPLTERCMMP